MPPDNCFFFESATGSIIYYYDNEDGDPANPACPKDVDIPREIGGYPVADITLFSFEYEGLTSVTIPDTVTSIGRQAFSSNKLTSVTIPGSVQTIGNDAFANNLISSLTLGEGIEAIYQFAFANNRLKEVFIPDSVKSIWYLAFTYNQITTAHILSNVNDLDASTFANQPSSPTFYEDMDSGDPAKMKAARDTIFYTRVYTNDLTNPNNLQSKAGCSDSGDGSINCDGGHLINPATLTMTYRNTAGSELQSSQTIVGVDGSGKVLTNYLVTSNLPASASQTDIDAMLARYTYINQPYTATAPTISGYSIVTPTSPHAMTLASADNTLDFVYSNPGETTPAATNANANANANNDPLAVTGANIWVYVSVAISAIVMSFVGIRRNTLNEHS